MTESMRVATGGVLGEDHTLFFELHPHAFTGQDLDKKVGASGLVQRVLVGEFPGYSEGDLFRQGGRVVARSVPYEKNAVFSCTHRGALEAPHGFVQPLVKLGSGGDMDVYFF